MNNTHHSSNKEILPQALRLRSPERRAAYLEELVACDEPRRRHFCVILLDCL